MPEPDFNNLCAAVALACQPQNVGRIMLGRRQVAEMPREWVSDHIDEAARSVLDFGDYWEYGRLLELLEHIGASAKVKSLVAEGLANAEADVRDMADIWATRGETATG